MAGTFAWHKLPVAGEQKIWVAETPLGQARIAEVDGVKNGYLAVVTDVSAWCETRDEAEIWVEDTVLYQIEKHQLETADETCLAGVG